MDSFNILDFPPEIILNILSYLDDIQFTLTVSTCKALQEYLNTRFINKLVELGDIKNNRNSEKFMNIFVKCNDICSINKYLLNSKANIISSITYDKLKYISIPPKMTQLLISSTYFDLVDITDQDISSDESNTIDWDRSSLSLKKLKISNYKKNINSIIPQTVIDLHLNQCDVGNIDDECLPNNLNKLSITSTNCTLNSIPKNVTKIMADSILTAQIFRILPQNLIKLDLTVANKFINSQYHLNYDLSKGLLPKGLKILKFYIGKYAIVDESSIPDSIVSQKIIFYYCNFIKNAVARTPTNLNIGFTPYCQNLEPGDIPNTVKKLNLKNVKIIGSGVIPNSVQHLKLTINGIEINLRKYPRKNLNNIKIVLPQQSNLEKLEIKNTRNDINNIKIVSPPQSKLYYFACKHLLDKIELSSNSITYLELYLKNSMIISKISQRIEKLVINRKYENRLCC